MKKQNKHKFDSLVSQKGSFHSINHLQLIVESEGAIRIKLGPFLSKVIGDAKFNPQLQAGAKLTKGEYIGQIQQNDKYLDILSPLSGEILAINKEAAVLADTDTKQESAWLFTIKPSNWMNERAHTLAEESSDAWFKSETIRFRDFLAASLWKNNQAGSAQVLYDGGELRPQILQILPQEIWKDLAQDFLFSGS